MKAELVFMAAGIGTRFGGGVKQLEPIGPHGEVLMDYAVHDALAAGFDRVIFIIRRDLEAYFRSGVGRRVEKKCDVQYVYQDTADIPAGFDHLLDRQKPWGTGQAVLACRDVIQGPFCVLNADDYYGAEAFRRIYRFLKQGGRNDELMQLCMAGYVLGNTLSESGAVTRGICRVGREGRLLGIQETKGVELENGLPCVKTADGPQYLDREAVVSMNMWGLPKAFLDYLGEEFVPFLQGLDENRLQAEYLLPEVVARMIQTGRGEVQVLPTRDKWFGMTYAQDKLLTRQRIRERIADGYYPDEL